MLHVLVGGCNTNVALFIFRKEQAIFTWVHPSCQSGSMGGGAGGCFAFSRTTRIGGILKLPIFESSASNHTLTRQESGGQSALPPARQSMSEHLRGPAQNIFGMEFCRRIYQESFDEIAKRDAPKPRRRKSSLQHMKEQNVRMHRATSIRPGDISFHSKAKFHDNSEGIGEEDAVQQKVYGLVGQFLDPELEDDFREDCPADLASRCLHFLFSSRTMGFVLFSSVSSLGQTSGWTTPPGLTGAVAGKKMNFDDVIITSWLWVALAILFFASLLLPPFVMTLHKWWGPQLAFATQSFIFGLATLTTMICTPSVLSLGVPLSFIAQVLKCPSSMQTSCTTLRCLLFCPRRHYSVESRTCICDWRADARCLALH